MIETADSASGEEVLFREVQRFRQPWLWVLLFGGWAVTVGEFGGAMVKQLLLGRPWGDRQMSDSQLLGFALAVIALATLAVAFMASLKLITEVRGGGLQVRFFPLHLRFHRIPLEDADEIEARRYHPILSYGGWGIRYGFRGKAYNVSGNRGVLITFRSGKRLLIGSGRPEELAAAMETARRRAWEHPPRE